MELIILVALVSYHFYVTNKFRVLENDIKSLRNLLSRSGEKSIGDTPAPASTEFADINNQTDESVTSVSPAFSPQTVTSNQFAPDISTNQELGESPFISWIKQDFLVKLGAFLLLIAFGWFVSYAFANNWIGPVGRITIGVVIGVMVMALGVVRINKFVHQGAIFTVLGSSIVLLTIFAARHIYDFFTPTSALVFMFLTVAFVAFVSVRYERHQLAMASLVLGAIAPMLTNSPTPDVFGLFTYLTMLVMGTVWVVYLLRSSSLTLVALLIVAVYGLPYMDSYNHADKFIGLLFAFFFTAVFLLTNIQSILSSHFKEGEHIQYVTALATGGYLLLWIALAAPEIWQTPLYLMWMIVFSTGTFVTYMRTANRLPFYMYGSVSLALLMAATASLFEGPALTIAFAVEIMALVLATNNVVANSLVARRLSLLYIGLVIFSFQHFSDWLGLGSFTAGDVMALVAVAVSLGVSGISLVRTKPDIAPEEDTLQPGVALIGTSVFYFLSILWLVLHDNLPDGEATTMCLIIYTLIGLGAYLYGKAGEYKAVATGGSLIIGGVIIRLLLIDVWQLALAERIIVFFIVGVLLLSTAFLKKKSIN